MKEGMPQFPILQSFSEKYRKAIAAARIPTSVPWELVAPHEARARRNHNQTLARLAERGGLAPSELLSLLQDKPLNFRVQDDLEGIAAQLEALGVELLAEVK